MSYQNTKEVGRYSLDEEYHFVDGADQDYLVKVLEDSESPHQFVTKRRAGGGPKLTSLVVSGVTLDLTGLDLGQVRKLASKSPDLLGLVEVAHNLKLL